MTAENYTDARGLRMEIEVLEGVDHVDQAACEFDGLGGGEGGAGAGAIDVAANRHDGGDAAEFGEDFGVAYIAGVEDVGDTGEGWEKLRAEETVGVGDDADEHR